jgi:hypothetical protein
MEFGNDKCPSGYAKGPMEESSEDNNRVSENWPCVGSKAGGGLAVFWNDDQVSYWNFLELYTLVRYVQS